MLVQRLSSMNAVSCQKTNPCYTAGVCHCFGLHHCQMSLPLGAVRPSLHMLQFQWQVLLLHRHKRFTSSFETGWARMSLQRCPKRLASSMAGQWAPRTQMSWQHSLMWMDSWWEELRSSLNLWMLLSLAPRAPKRLKQHCKLRFDSSAKRCCTTLCYAAAEMRDLCTQFVGEVWLGSVTCVCWHICVSDKHRCGQPGWV